MPQRLNRQTLIRAIAVPVVTAVLLVVVAGSAGAASAPAPLEDVPTTGAVIPAPPTAQALGPVAHGTGHHETGRGNLPAAVWVGIAVSGAVAVLLLLGAAGFILPKPPKS